MFLMIDNYDSFVYNLKAYFEELGREIMVRRSDQINIEEIEKMQPEGIILSPGPKRPWDAVRCVETVKRFQGKIPILGVCLGHQVLAGVQHLLHLKSKSKILRPIEIMGFFYEFFCQIQGNNLL